MKKGSLNCVWDVVLLTLVRSLVILYFAFVIMIFVNKPNVDQLKIIIPSMIAPLVGLIAAMLRHYLKTNPDSRVV